jgi:prephenate dehydrogenase
MRVALIGVGLIGGSAALAWKRSGQVDAVIGFDLDAAACAAAQERGAIDRIVSSVADAVREAELVLLAVPVGAMAAVLAEVAAAVPAHAIVTDVGSTKRSVIEAARTALGAHSSFSFRRFVPGHPIAGGEKPGVANADAALFRGKLFVSTPVAETHPEALAQVEALWRGIGATVQRMAADEHDRVFAAISHLPHLLAFALVAQIAAEPDGARKLGFAGAGFRDFTRIAASSPALWRDIAIANRDALAIELRGHRTLLDRLQAALEAGDAVTLEAVFTQAAEARRAQQRSFDGE